MRITRVDVFKADIPLNRPFRIAVGEIRTASTIFVRVHVENGIYGMGEASLVTPIVGETQGTSSAAARDLAKLLIGADPLDIESRVSEMRRFMPFNPTTRSAFDMALYDLLGKAADLPLYAVLGGPRRVITTDNTVWLDRQAAMVEHAVRLKERGFPAVKVKLGTTAEEDIERVRGIREAVGPQLPIRVDANQGWDRVAALKALQGMESMGIQYCEQPVPAWDLVSMCFVSERSSIPIMADESVFDEHDALRLASMNACTYLNVKLAKSGGIHIALRINSVGEAAGMRCMVGCMTESRLGLSAAAHIASARANVVFADLDGADMLRDDPVVGGISYKDGGKIELPESAGIGADIAAEYLDGLDSYTVT